MATSERSCTSERSSASYAPTPLALEFRQTFKHMTMRRLRRQLGGTIHSQRSRAFLIVLAFALVAFGALDLSFGQSGQAENSTSTDDDGDVSVGLKLNILDDIALFALGGMTLVVALRISEVIRSAIYWMLVGLIAYIMLQFFCEDRQCRGRSYVVMLSTLGGVVLNVLMWGLTHHLYPYLLRTESGLLRDVMWWWSVRPLGPHRPSQFRYRPSAVWPILPFSRAINRWLRWPHRFCGYDGEVDSRGRPHGLGTWNDSAANGEYLYGVWEHGRPLGPFRATEYASGYTSRSVRVAYCHCRAEPLDGYWFQTLRHPEGPQWGVISVECSSAGKFFRHLPELTPVLGPSAARPAGRQWRQIGPVLAFGGGLPPLVARLVEDAVLERLLTHKVAEAEAAGYEVLDVELNAAEGEQLGAAAAAGVGDVVSAAGFYWKLMPPSAAWCIERLVKLDDPSLDGTMYPPTLVVTAGREGVQSPSAVVRTTVPCLVRGVTTTADLRLPSSARSPLPSTYESGRFSAEAPRGVESSSPDAYIRGLSGGNLPAVSEAEAAAAEESEGTAAAAAAHELHEAESWYLGNEPQAGLEVLSADGRRWTSNSESGNYEAVVFLHGFNSPTSDALKRIAQLWTLGEFPPHLHPFVFGWPAGKTVSYFRAKRMAMESDELVNDFVDFVESLDSSLERFLKADFGALRRLCEHVTLYADHSDGALAYSEFFNRERALGKHPFDLVSFEDGAEPSSATHSAVMAPRRERRQTGRPDGHREARTAAAAAGTKQSATGLHVAQVELVSCISSNGEAAGGAAEGAAAVSAAAAAPQQPAPSTAAVGSPRGRFFLGSRMAGLREQIRSGGEGADAEREWSRGRRPKRDVRGAPPLPPPGKRVVPLDLDVIDVSWMDNNVHSMRHNFFNVNRWMIDDIREVILTQRRARLRTARMTHRFTNVWSFLAAPRHIVNP